MTRQPDLLLLDEPFAFLDIAGVHQLLTLLNQRVQQGQTVLLIEHRLELLQGLCDRTYHIHGGGLQPMALSAPSIAETPQPEPSPPPPLINQQSDRPVLLTQHLSWGGYPLFPDLQVYAGEIILLRGENGCGKTTLLKLLSGLLKPETGSLEIQGTEVTGQSAVQIARTVGFVLQNPNHQLFAESVEAEVHQPGVSAAQTQTLLAQLNLNQRADQHPQALSQGQKRRLALGAVLARRPQICLLDEIMVGQDATSLSLMLSTLKTFTDAGGTLIFTSHDPGVATVLNPRVVTIRGTAYRRNYSDVHFD